MEQFAILQRRKTRCQYGIVAGAAFLFVSLPIRFIPGLNDKLCGPPRYMQAVATVMARQLAAATQGQYPVLVAAREESDCRAVNLPEADDYDDQYFVIRYSEKARLLCLDGYAKGVRSSKSPTAATLNPDIGRNFGRALTAPVRVILSYRKPSVLPQDYLSLLHWRTKANPLSAASGGVSHLLTSPGGGAVANLSVNYVDLRAEVAKRHNWINRLLLFIILSGVGAVLASLATLRLLYSECAQSLRGYDFSLSMNLFLSENLNKVGELAQNRYHEYRQHLQTQARLDHFYRREKQEVQRHLKALLAAASDDERRLLIQKTLDSGGLEEMHALLDHLQPQTREKLPEERLRLLLEAIKEYCTESEFQDCQNEVLKVFHRSGFREAREIIVRRHDELRARSKALKEDEEDQQVRQVFQRHSSP
ncbi:MAG TPA: hypothetical protein VGK99_10980 [Acidobacteriota bacterium]|jgi:hypothetical protein